MRPALPGASAFAHRVVSQRRSSCRITMRALLRGNQTPPSDGLEKGTSHVARSRQYPGFGPRAGCHWHPYIPTPQKRRWLSNRIFGAFGPSRRLWTRMRVRMRRWPMAHGAVGQYYASMSHTVSHFPVVPRFPKLGRTDHLQHPGLAWQERTCQAGTEQPANFHLLSHHAHELILSTASR